MDGGTSGRHCKRPCPAGRCSRQAAGRADRRRRAERHPDPARSEGAALEHRGSSALPVHGRTAGCRRSCHGPPAGLLRVPHGSVPGGRLLSERQKNLSARAEPPPELPVHRLCRTGKPAAGGRPHPAGGAALQRSAHQPLSPEPIFSGRVRPARFAGIHRAAGLAAYRR